MKTGSFIVLLAAIIISFNSCKKLREDNLINGLWRLNGIYIDSTFSYNQLNDLPHFTDGNRCCEYQLDFQDGDRLLGYYVTYDTFTYIKTGNWELRDYDHVYMKLDEYIDGEFEIKKQAGLPVILELFGKDNHIKAFTNTGRPDTAFTTLELERE